MICPTLGLPDDNILTKLPTVVVVHWPEIKEQILRFLT
jgi:hypothetical protein